MQGLELKKKKKLDDKETKVLDSIQVTEDLRLFKVFIRLLLPKVTQVKYNCIASREKEQKLHSGQTLSTSSPVVSLLTGYLSNTRPTCGLLRLTYSREDNCGEMSILLVQ